MLRHETVDALVEAITRRRLADGSTEVEQINRTIDGGALSGVRSNGRLRVQRDAAGALSARLIQQVQSQTPQAVVTELVVVGEHGYVRLDQRTRPEPRHPWMRLDPAAGDAVSAHYQPQVAWLRRDHPIDIVLAGTAGVVDAEPEPEPVDGVPAMRYTLHVEVDGSGEDAATAEQLRGRGLTSIQPVVHLDAADRLLRIRTAVDFPNGGSLLTRLRMLGQGEPLTISAPPAAQVVTLPQ